LSVQFFTNHAMSKSEVNRHLRADPTRVGSTCEYPVSFTRQYQHAHHTQSEKRQSHDGQRIRHLPTWAIVSQRETFETPRCCVLVVVRRMIEDLRR